MRVHEMDPRGFAAFFPSDHHFSDDEAFVGQVGFALASAEARPNWCLCWHHARVPGGGIRLAVLSVGNRDIGPSLLRIAPHQLFSRCPLGANGQPRRTLRTGLRWNDLGKPNRVLSVLERKSCHTQWGFTRDTPEEGRGSRSRDPVALIGGGEIGRKDSRDGIGIQ